MTENLDGALPLARRRLENAVHALADPQPVWAGGVCRWSDALYVRLRGALTGRGGERRHDGAFGSRAPCRSGVLALLVEIDRAVGGWEPHGKSTTDRLRQLVGNGWRPQDCDLLTEYADRVEAWTLTAVELLGDRSPTVALRLPCPSCERLHVYRRNSGGESVRSWALRVSEDGCVCLGCRAEWSPDEFHWLARLLGCDPVPAA